MTFDPLLIAGLASAATVLLGTVAFKRRRAAAAQQQAQAAQSLPDDLADQIADRLATKLGLDEDVTLKSLSSDLSDMREGFAWLVSDRMIDEAIAMAQIGEEPRSISSQTGISETELAAIEKLRRASQLN